MKIGTISLNINAPDFNYGAVLHSWAFQQFLKEQECVDYTEIIDYTMPKLENQSLKYPILSNLRNKHFRSLLRCLRHYCRYRKRYKKFQAFIAKNISKSATQFIQSTLNSAKLNYDCVICESDVIWSPGFSGGHFDKSFFLALDSMRYLTRIAYAPSMADGDLNSEQERELRELLNYPQYISCRETYEKEILEKYTDKPVTHVLDPVMLLDASQYMKICAERLGDKPYVLLYLPVDDNYELRRAAEIYAYKYGLKIVEISTHLKAERGKTGVCYGSAGIEEFLSAIRYADVVFTNSFHAICFSIIFHVQFYAFSRTYAGKVRDICDVFHLKHRYFEDRAFKETEPIDYSIVDKTKERLVSQSKTWILSILNNQCEK